MNGLVLAEKVRDALEKAGVTGSSFEFELTPLERGDYATSVALKFAKQLKTTPPALAKSVVEYIGQIDGVEISIATSGFINFKLSGNLIARSIEKAVVEDMWGSNSTLSGKKVMVEYTDPNPFKEFHIGHLMSNAIGESISRLLQFSGAEVKRANYQGDVGPHVAKCIWAMQKHGVTNAVFIEAVGKQYAEGAKAYEEDPEAKEEIDAINRKIYDKSDPAINLLYSLGRSASLEHFEDIYKTLGTKFDYYFFESVTAPKGIEIVRANPETFEESDGAIVFKGEKVDLHTRVFITSQGLPTYETKELGLAMLKEETWSADTSITITAHEQAGYFAVVLAAMREVMPEIAKKIQHISHGMMRFAEGKMSSRTGNVVTGESLLEELIEVAKERAKESRADDVDALARDVAVGAIKYQILKQSSHKDIVFDRERALSLEGDSGPYLQYAHARAHQIVERAKAEGITPALDTGVSPSELSRLMHRFPEIIEEASNLRESHVLATYLIALSAAFNAWYAKEQILDGTARAAHKVALTAAFARTMKNGLWILGIPAPEKM